MQNMITKKLTTLKQMSFKQLKAYSEKIDRIHAEIREAINRKLKATKDVGEN